ncbi:hypothetical protein Taro_001152 [Colocasia esculenta]|uniref:RRM domain-containing protein n=1 Tax=Colocasia esculenta TaxID=4460 RepID=A0A843TDX4_COLES|nr:hypothetical protein [Colocasia esculenta]
MAVIEGNGGVDLGTEAGAIGSGDHEPGAVESAAALHSPAEDADAQGQRPLGAVPPVFLQQQQRSLSLVSVVDTNQLPQGFPPVGRPQLSPAALHAKLRQRSFQTFGHGIGRVDETQNVRGGGMMAAALQSNGADGGRNDEVAGEGFNRDIRDLEELLSKLNPMAEEFVPSSLVSNVRSGDDGGVGDNLYNNNFGAQQQNIEDGDNHANANGGRRRRYNYIQGKRRMNSRTSMAQRDEIIRRTVYVSDIDQQVTEEQLAALFVNCGQVVDCRVCGDPNSVLRFAFIEFTDEEGARTALSLSGTMLGYYPVRVLPSKTAIAPVNPTYLPRVRFIHRSDSMLVVNSEDEREMCSRTVYCTNIDKNVSQADVKLFFETICGEVFRLRLLGDSHHSTRIAFVEFVMVCILGFKAIHGESIQDSSASTCPSPFCALNLAGRSKWISREVNAVMGVGSNGEIQRLMD